MIHGVDVASFQGKPASWQDSAGRIDFAAVKISELQPDGARYIDPDAAADWAWLGARKLGRIAYLFGHPSTSVAATVALFTDELHRLGLAAGDAVAVDLERTDGRPAREVAAWGAAVLAALERAFTRLPLLYTYLAFAEAGNCVGLGQAPLWISDPSSPAGHPVIPAPWKTWHLHQYSTGGVIDRDVAAYPDLAAMAAALGQPQRKAGWHTTVGEGSLAALAASHGCKVSTIVRETAAKSEGGVFADNVAGYLNDVFAGKASPVAKMPAGLRLWLPA
jgi:lysozyme